MNEKSKRIWTKPRTGPRAFLFGALIVFFSAFLFAAILTTIVSFVVPGAVYFWSGGYPHWVWVMPGLVPALTGLKVMALFIVAVAAAGVFYRVFRRLFRPAAIGTANTTQTQTGLGHG